MSREIVSIVVAIGFLILVGVGAYVILDALSQVIRGLL